MFPWQWRAGNPSGRVGLIRLNGGKIRDGEAFTIRGSGFTGLTTCDINGIACGTFVVVDDNMITAVAPADDLLHGTTYSMVLE